MGYFVLKRFIYSILTLFIIITVTFFLMHSIPGSVYTSDKALSPGIVKNLQAKYNLDKPLFEQYMKVLSNLIHLDFGMSMKNEGIRVNEIIARHFPNSAVLGLFAIFLCLLAGIPLGIVSALKNGRWQDNASMVIATAGVTVPGFIVAALTQYLLSVRLSIFPVMGFDTIMHVFLPAFALSFFPLAFIARLIRSSMLETLGQDYIRAARARGLSRQAVVFRHALKNSAIPVVTYLGPLAAQILTGSFAVEKIFNIPGLGRYYVDSISGRDYTTIMGITVFYATFLILMNFFVDIIYVIIDPRIRLKG